MLLSFFFLFQTTLSFAQNANLRRDERSPVIQAADKYLFNRAGCADPTDQEIAQLLCTPCQKRAQTLKDARKAMELFYFDQAFEIDARDMACQFRILDGYDLRDSAEAEIKGHEGNLNVIRQTIQTRIDIPCTTEECRQRKSDFAKLKLRDPSADRKVEAQNKQTLIVEDMALKIERMRKIKSKLADLANDPKFQYFTFRQKTGSRAAATLNTKRMDEIKKTYKLDQVTASGQAAFLKKHQAQENSLEAAYALLQTSIFEGGDKPETFTLDEDTIQTGRTSPNPDVNEVIRKAMNEPNFSRESFVKKMLSGGDESYQKQVIEKTKVKIEGRLHELKLETGNRYNRQGLMRPFDYSEDYKRSVHERGLHQRIMEEFDEPDDDKEAKTKTAIDGLGCSYSYRYFKNGNANWEALSVVTSFVPLFGAAAFIKKAYTARKALRGVDIAKKTSQAASNGRKVMAAAGGLATASYGAAEAADSVRGSFLTGESMLDSLSPYYRDRKNLFERNDIACKQTAKDLTSELKNDLCIRNESFNSSLQKMNLEGSEILQGLRLSTAGCP